MGRGDEGEGKGEGKEEEEGGRRRRKTGKRRRKEKEGGERRRKKKKKEEGGGDYALILNPADNSHAVNLLTWQLSAGGMLV